MNSAFHSSGTASGNVEMMNTWNPIMPSTATAVSVSLFEKIRISGKPASTAVPIACVKRMPYGDGRMSSGKSR